MYSRVSVITITYRSNHMPIRTEMQISISQNAFMRTLLDHSNVAGTTKLQKIRHQYDQPYGPNIRSMVVPHS